MKIYERWTESMKALTATREYRAFEDAFEEILNDLVRAAKQPI